jgi:hypothetical protein
MKPRRMRWNGHVTGMGEKKECGYGFEYNIKMDDREIGWGY